MGKLYLVGFGISPKTLKNRNLRKIQNYKVSSDSLFYWLISQKNTLFYYFFDKFINDLKIKTICLNIWANYI